MIFKSWIWIDSESEIASIWSLEIKLLRLKGLYVDDSLMLKMKKYQYRIEIYQIYELKNCEFS
jgi:hypothetical protein